MLAAVCSGEVLVSVARAMYAMRFGEIVRTRTIEVLRGQEGGRIKRAYALAAERYGLQWRGRHYSRDNPSAGDLPNQAINHAASAMTAAASVARRARSRSWASCTRSPDSPSCWTWPTCFAMTFFSTSRLVRQRRLLEASR